jgi:hypothetical protein
VGAVDGGGGETLNYPLRRLRYAAVEIWGNAVILAGTTNKQNNEQERIGSEDGPFDVLHRRQSNPENAKAFRPGENRQKTINEKTTNEDQALLETVVRWPGDKR